MYKLFILILSLLCLAQPINLIYYQQLPVSRLTLYKALLSMKHLKESLDRTFNTKFQNKMVYYVRTKLTEIYLNQISDELAQYSNVMIGQDNGVIGRNNLIVGDENAVLGENNWVFSEGFEGQANKDLILDHWQVQVDKAETIPINPHIAIRQW